MCVVLMGVTNSKYMKELYHVMVLTRTCDRLVTCVVCVEHVPDL